MGRAGELHVDPGSCAVLGVQPITAGRFVQPMPIPPVAALAGVDVTNGVVLALGR